MDKFDLKKYLAEGKLLNEEIEVPKVWKGKEQITQFYKEFSKHFESKLDKSIHNDEIKTLQVYKILADVFKASLEDDIVEGDPVEYAEKMADLINTKLAEGKLNEEADINQAKNYAQQFMQSFQKMRNVVRGNFGSETEEKFVEEVKEKMKAKLYSND